MLVSAGGGDINGPHLSVVTASAAAVLTLLQRLLNIGTVNIVITHPVSSLQVETRFWGMEVTGGSVIAELAASKY